jgi:hypothetical protein
MFESKINRGKANGYAPLGSTGKVPLENLPPIQSTLNTGSFATTGSNTFTGVQTLAGTSGTSWAEFTIGQTGEAGYSSYDLRATGSSQAGVSVTSDVVSLFGVITNEGFAGDVSLFQNGRYGFPYSDGPIAGISVQKSGSQVSNWIFNYDGKNYFPSDITIGYQTLDNGLTSGSLNVTNGNINVSGSIFVSGSVYANNLTNFATTGSNIFKGNQSISGSLNISSSMIISSTVVNNGNINALNSDLIIDGGDIILSGSFAQQVNYAPFGSGSWDVNPPTEVTNLDITKNIHLIDITSYESYSNFYLPNGLYDGQVVRFALKGNSVSSPNTVYIWMDNLRTYDGSIQSNTTWSPFWDNGGGGADNPRSLATAVYIDGAWNIDSDWWGM